jgi:polysaccharide pyruvyl transferase WcaK-like protein
MRTFEGNDARPARRIGILGHVGNGNLGDEAIIAALVQNLREHCPGVELRAFAANPEDTTARHGIPAFPLRRRPSSGPGVAGNPDTERPGHAGPESRGRLRLWVRRRPLVRRAARGLLFGLRLLPDSLQELRFLASCHRRLRAVDLLIVAGSGQLFDGFGGSWAFPYTLFKWSLLGRLSRARVVFLSVGAGPIDARLSRFFIRRALGLADYHSYRDESSRALIESLGVSGPNPVVPDLACSLRLPPAPARPRGRLVVGINPMAYAAPHYWPVPDPDVYAAYVVKLADFARWLVGRGYGVRFFASQVRADVPVVDDILVRIRIAEPGVLDRIVRDPVADLHGLIVQIQASDIVVATRYHGILLSCLIGRPVLALAYHRKSADLMAAFGQSDHVLDVLQCDFGGLVQGFTRLEASADAVRQRLRERLPVHQAALARQYEAVLGPWPEARTTARLLPSRHSPG